MTNITKSTLKNRKYDYEEVQTMLLALLMYNGNKSNIIGINYGEQADTVMKAVLSVEHTQKSMITILGRLTNLEESDQSWAEYVMQSIDQSWANDGSDPKVNVDFELLKESITKFEHVDMLTAQECVNISMFFDMIKISSKFAYKAHKQLKEQ